MGCKNSASTYYLQVYGNEVVHLGEINLKDDEETVLILFDVLNIMYVI
jgi:hypothetical protein